MTETNVTTNITSRMVEVSLSGLDQNETFPDKYLKSGPPVDIFGPRSLNDPVKKYSPSYMTDMFGAGIPESIHRVKPRRTRSPYRTNRIRPDQETADQKPVGKELIIYDPLDDRLIVPDTTMPPWRCICRIETIMTDGTSAFGTGWFAAANIVVTAGHCLYDTDGREPSLIYVTPGLDGYDAPYNSQESQTVRVPLRWVKHKDDRYDFGIIVLPNKQMGNQTGWFGYAAAKDSHLSNMYIMSAGYPEDYNNDTQLSCTGRIKSMDRYYLGHNIDTARGQSGSPLFHKHKSGARTVIGIHTESKGSLNSAVRITSFVFDEISRTVKDNQ